MSSNNETKLTFLKHDIQNFDRETLVSQNAQTTKNDDLTTSLSLFQQNTSSIIKKKRSKRAQQNKRIILLKSMQKTIENKIITFLKLIDIFVESSIKLFVRNFVQLKINVNKKSKN